MEQSRKNRRFWVYPKILREKVANAAANAGGEIQKG